MEAAGNVGSVGIVGRPTGTVVERVRDSNLELVAASTDVTEALESRADVIVCLGTDALARTARERPDVPLLSVDGPIGARTVNSDDIDVVCRALADGRWQVTTRDVLPVDATDRQVWTFLSVTVMADPGGISEFGIATEGDDGRVAVDRVRADGIALATPLGSQEYAHAAGGPAVEPGVGAVSAVPVGPFTIDQDHWILKPPLWITVEREETTVTLDVDGAVVDHLGGGETIGVRRGTSIPLAVVDAGADFFRRADRLEKT